MHDTLQTGPNVSGFDTENVLPETVDDMTRDGERTRAIFADTGARFGAAMDRAGQQIASDGSVVADTAAPASTGAALSSSFGSSVMEEEGTSNADFNSGAGYSKVRAVDAEPETTVATAAPKSATVTLGRQGDHTADVEFPLSAA